MRRLAGWVLGLLLLAAATLPFWAQLPQPQGAQRLDRALLIPPDGSPPRPVALPHDWPDRSTSEAGYRLQFELQAVPTETLYLFIPMLSQRVLVSMGGRQVADTGNRARLVGLTSGLPALVALPADRLVAGANTVDVRLLSVGVFPGHLSAVHVGTAEQVGPHYRLRLFLLEHLRLMVLATQLLIATAVFMACLYRPREPLFLWLLAVLATSLAGFAGLFIDLVPGSAGLMPFAFMVSMAGTMMLPVVALLINGARPPRWLQVGVVAVPLACVLVGASGLVPAPRVALAVGGPLTVLSIASGAAITIRGAWQGVHEARLLLAPMLLLALAAVHDGAIAARLLPGPVFLGMYYRPLIVIGVAVILMRRLGLSLRHLDEANVHLQQRLAEREAELARLHEEERREAAQRVRDEERQRLTADLHDGVSGHLASILALAERERSATIERTAREALDDLRLVIHSLDIGDRELAVALASLRDRLQRQLKRLRIDLDWSIARLPEVSGVTPAHALNVLRILQEAVTNAIRHGRASTIRIHAEPHGAHGARIVVENEGAPYPPTPCGRGLKNMRLRAAALGGMVAIEAREGGGARLTLDLPLRLPG